MKGQRRSGKITRIIYCKIMKQSGRRLVNKYGMIHLQKYCVPANHELT